MIKMCKRCVSCDSIFEEEIPTSESRKRYFKDLFEKIPTCSFCEPEVNEPDIKFRRLNR